jgi:hypothetical protein
VSAHVKQRRLIQLFTSVPTASVYIDTNGIIHSPALLVQKRTKCAVLHYLYSIPLFMKHCMTDVASYNIFGAALLMWRHEIYAVPHYRCGIVNLMRYRIINAASQN